MLQPLVLTLHLDAASDKLLTTSELATPSYHRTTYPHISLQFTPSPLLSVVSSNKNLSLIATVERPFMAGIKSRFSLRKKGLLSTSPPSNYEV